MPPVHVIVALKVPVGAGGGGEGEGGGGVAAGDPAPGGGGEGDGGGGDPAGGVTKKVTVEEEPPDSVNDWPKTVSVLLFQPSPHESVIESEHGTDAVEVTDPEYGAPPDAMNAPPHESDQLTSYG